ncbi:MAG: Rpn family recombination-promoting nuclease/putative transposase [Aulosira sp. ZfuCHP01]|nr:Rpn family recombination-promoting nuclease/putative transposase [Aulosira sp. ZfuCHP01]
MQVPQLIHFQTNLEYSFFVIPNADIYLRLISEIALYLRQNKPKNPWRGVVIYPSRDIDVGDKEHFLELFQSQRISIIYLDELGESASLPIGIATIKLVIEGEDTAINTPRELINRTQQAENLQLPQKQLLNGVFLPIQEESPIYFVEVQFQPDSDIYLRLISEVALYLRQNKPKNPWRGVVIYPSRDIDVGDKEHFLELFQSQRISIIYLDELGESASLPIGIATIKLVIEGEDTAINTPRELINRTQQAVNLELPQKQLLELIETILVYKFPQMSQKEIEAMFGLSDLKQTRVYQEAEQEGKQKGRLEAKLEAVPKFLALGLTVEQIAQALDLDIAQVQQVAQQTPPNQ